MLAGEILATANSPAYRMLVAAISALDIATRRAKRFDRERGIVVTANTISGSSSGAQLRALPLCRDVGTSRGLHAASITRSITIKAGPYAGRSPSVGWLANKTKKQGNWPANSSIGWRS
jgi:hypothetical protein